MKRNFIGIFLLLLFLVSTDISLAGVTYKFRVYLSDKKRSDYSLKKPLEFLSQRALDRRNRQHISLVPSDLPVSHEYLRTIGKAGALVLAVSKWNNTALVSLSDSLLINKISLLPFVLKTECVWRGDISKEKKAVPDSVVNRLQKDSLYYGPATYQITLHHGQLLHHAGFVGKGMVIAIVDGGYMNFDKLELLNNIHILGMHDFVNPRSDLSNELDHGMKVLSCMAANKPYVMVGTAPDASYWLFRSEDGNSENPVEEDYWAAAVEYADSVGADLINSSLGYFKFDNSIQDIMYRQLDGKSTLISCTASMIADKGMILINSAGNSGMDSWKKISVPADADNILTVGAIDNNNRLAPFSSIGNTADNRVKPDVVSLGINVSVSRMDGKGVGRGNGTSFATPVICGLVACLWQACPQLTAKQIIQLVRQSSDRYAYPDNIYGYGIPDMWKAYLSVYPEKVNK